MRSFQIEDELFNLIKRKNEFLAIHILNHPEINLNHTDADRNTPLILACMNNLTNVSLFIIGKGNVDLGKTNKNGETALIHACRNNMVHVALILLQTRHSNIGQMDNILKSTALMHACENSMNNVALALIQTGESNPGQINNDGDTALIIACSQTMSEVAMALIQTGESNPGQIDNDGDTALLIACQYNSEEQSKRMTHVALALIQTGESRPGQVDLLGNTTLIYACMSEMTTVAIALIQTGESNQDHVNDNGNNALYFAEENHMTEVVDLLQQVNTHSVGLQKKGIMEVNDDMVGNNFIQQEFEVPISKWMKEDDENICIIFDSNKLLTSKSVLNSTLGDNSNLKYECYITGTLAPYNINQNVEYYVMRSIGLYGLVDVRIIKEIINHTGDEKIFVIQKTDKLLKTTVSKSILQGESDFVSGSHCQEGQEDYVYEILAYVPDIKNTSSGKKMKKTKGKRSKAKKWNGKTMKKRHTKTKKIRKDKL